MTNQELGRHLRNLQAFLVIAGYDEMRARLYMHISHEIESMGEPIETLWREGRLQEINGVGPSMARTIKEILETGRSSKQEEYEQQVPFSVLELLRIPGLGLKTAQRLLYERGVHSLESLRVAIDAGRLAGVAGIGDKTIRNWREAIERILSR